jgi:hypothetical protein
VELREVLISPDGRIVARFRPKTTPEDPARSPPSSASAGEVQSRGPGSPSASRLRLTWSVGESLEQRTRLAASKLAQLPLPQDAFIR